jgi:hypothetical protein
LKLDRLPVVYWIAAAAFAARLIARICQGIDLFWVNGYSFFFDLAQSIAAGNGVAFPGCPPTAFRVPLYPIFLAGLTLGHQAFWPIAIAQSLIGALTVLYAAQLARAMFPGQIGANAANWAAAGTAFYPYYVIHDTALEETSLFTVLTLVSVLLVLRSLCARQMTCGAVAGLLLGLDVLTRATIAPFALLVPFWLVWQKRVRGGMACGILLVATVSPWLWRNFVLTGVPTLSTETGIELWNGNNGFLFDYYPQQSSDLSKGEALDALTPHDQREFQKMSNNEMAMSRWFAHKAWDHIRLHPGQTIVDGFRKIAAGFFFLPSPRRGRLADLVYAVTYGPVMVIGLWGMWRRRSHWRNDSLIYLLFASFLIVTAVFWAHTSHRAFLDVYWIVFGTGALVQSGLSNKLCGSGSARANQTHSPDRR